MLVNGLATPLCPVHLMSLQGNLCLSAGPVFPCLSQHRQNIEAAAARAARASERAAEAAARKLRLSVAQQRKAVEKIIIVNERCAAHREAQEQQRAAERERRERQRIEVREAHAAQEAMAATLKRHGIRLDPTRPTPVAVPDEDAANVCTDADLGEGDGDGVDEDESEEESGEESEEESEGEESEGEEEEEAAPLSPGFRIHTDSPHRTEAQRRIRRVALTERGGMPGPTRPVFQSMDNHLHESR